MSKIYLDQTALRLTLTAEVDITGAITTQIKYRKSDGTTGVWDATVETASDGTIYHDFTEGDLDVLGTWTAWTYVVFSDGRYADGEPIKFRVYNPGS